MQTAFNILILLLSCLGAVRLWQVGWALGKRRAAHRSGRPVTGPAPMAETVLWAVILMSVAITVTVLSGRG